MISNSNTVSNINIFLKNWVILGGKRFHLFTKYFGFQWKTYIKGDGGGRKRDRAHLQICHDFSTMIYYLLYNYILLLTSPVEMLDVHIVRPGVLWNVLSFSTCVSFWPIAIAISIIILCKMYFNVCIYSYNTFLHQGRYTASSTWLTLPMAIGQEPEVQPVCANELFHKRRTSKTEIWVLA